MCWNLLKVLVQRSLVEVCNVWNFWENSFGGFCAKRFNFRPIMKIEFSQIDAKLRRPSAQNFALFQKCSTWCRGSWLKFLCNLIEYSERTNTFSKNNTSKNRYWVYDLKVVNLLRSFFQKNCPFSTNNWWNCTKISGLNLCTVGNTLKIQKTLCSGTVRNYACGCENYDVKVGVFYKKSTEWNFEKNSQNTYIDPIFSVKNFRKI